MIGSGVTHCEIISSSRFFSLLSAPSVINGGGGAVSSFGATAAVCTTVHLPAAVSSAFASLLAASCAFSRFRIATRIDVAGSNSSPLALFFSGSESESELESELLDEAARFFFFFERFFFFLSFLSSFLLFFFLPSLMGIKPEVKKSFGPLSGPPPNGIEPGARSRIRSYAFCRSDIQSISKFACDSMYC